MELPIGTRDTLVLYILLYLFAFMWCYFTRFYAVMYVLCFYKHVVLCQKMTKKLINRTDPLALEQCAFHNFPLKTYIVVGPFYYSRVTEDSTIGWHHLSSPLERFVTMATALVLAVLIQHLDKISAISEYQ